MKKVVNILIRIILMIMFITPYCLEPFAIVNAAKSYDDFTIKGMRKELEELRAEKTRRQNEKKQTESEISTKKSESLQAREEKDQIAGKVEALETEIKESELEIERLTEQTDEIMRLMQIYENTDIYLEYVAEASTIMDLIVRTSVINQMTSHNESVINSLNALIKANNEKKEELRLRNIELEEKIADLSKKLNSLGNRLAELSEISLDIDTEIKNLNELINFYKSACKNEDQKVSSCVDIPVSTRWLKPLSRGYITSDYGYRTNPITGAKNSYHGALDIGGNSEGTSLYAPASGMVAAVVYRAKCGGNQVFIHININGQPYTVQMVHMLSYNVKVGDKVTVDTIVGKVGGGSGTKGWETCSTGAHLHYAVAKGYYKGKYADFLANDLRAPGFPAYHEWFTSRY